MKSNLRTLVATGAAMGVLLWTSVPAVADSTMSPEEQLATQTAAPTPYNEHPFVTAYTPTTVELMGVTIANLRAPASELSPQERREIVQRRLIESLARPITSESAVELLDFHGEKALFLNGHLIVTATVQDARENGTTPAVLGAVWADNLRAVARRFARGYFRAAGLRSPEE
ncbi:MAG: hypothetical protein HYU66_24665 [Armatimonadetes bacterium]|nr:hypothetical protein [Armatimonadota bacterium]